MYDIPPSAQRWYKMWISAYPESWHPNDMERFYFFVSVVLRVSRKPRGGDWLERNLHEDRPDLSQEVVTRYCVLFEHLQDFANVWKSHQAQIIRQSDREANLEALRKKGQGNKSNE